MSKILMSLGLLVALSTQAFAAGPKNNPRVPESDKEAQKILATVFSEKHTLEDLFFIFRVRGERLAFREKIDVTVVVSDELAQFMAERVFPRLKRKKFAELVKEFDEAVTEILINAHNRGVKRVLLDKAEAADIRASSLVMAVQFKKGRWLVDSFEYPVRGSSSVHIDADDSHSNGRSSPYDDANHRNQHPSHGPDDRGGSHGPDDRGGDSCAERATFLGEIGRNVGRDPGF